MASGACCQVATTPAAWPPKPWPSCSNEQPANGLILEPHLLKADLKKRARRIINRLHHRMENRIMRNTPDLAPFLTHDGETTSVVETVLAQDPSPLEILLE